MQQVLADRKPSTPAATVRAARDNALILIRFDDGTTQLATAAQSPAEADGLTCAGQVFLGRVTPAAVAALSARGTIKLIRFLRLSYS